MDRPRIVNAKIVRAMLGVNRGIMTFYLFCEWVGGEYGFGGCSKEGLNIVQDHTYQATCNILKVLEVDIWEKLPGTLIRIEDEGPGGRLTRIGHIMEDRWFDVGEYMKVGVGDA